MQRTRGMIATQNSLDTSAIVSEELVKIHKN